MLVYTISVTHCDVGRRRRDSTHCRTTNIHFCYVIISTITGYALCVVATLGNLLVCRGLPPPREFQLGVRDHGLRTTGTLTRVYLKCVVDAVHSQSFPLVALQSPDVLVLAAGLALLPVPGPGRPAAVPALSVRSGARVVADLP